MTGRGSGLEDTSPEERASPLSAQDRQRIDAIRRELEAEYVTAFGREASGPAAEREISGDMRERRRDRRVRTRERAGRGIVVAFLLGGLIGASVGAVVTALVLLGTGATVGEAPAPAQPVPPAGSAPGR